MADKPTTALNLPLVFTLALEPAAELPAAEHLNAAERERLNTISTLDRAREYLASRLLIRQALSHASALTGMETPAFSQLPASGPARLQQGLQLALSHTSGHIVCAVHDGRIGVDIECVHREPPWRALARRWFSEAEQQWLAARGSSQAFLLLWTLKEAWIKANHWGIAGNLQSIQLHAKAGEDPKLTADTQGRAWYAASACQQGLRVTLVWEGEGKPRTLVCQRLAGDPATAFTPMTQSWDPVITINNGGRQS